MNGKVKINCVRKNGNFLIFSFLLDFGKNQYSGTVEEEEQEVEKK